MSEGLQSRASANGALQARARKGSSLSLCSEIVRSLGYASVQFQHTTEPDQPVGQSYRPISLWGSLHAPGVLHDLAYGDLPLLAKVRASCPNFDQARSALHLRLADPVFAARVNRAALASPIGRSARQGRIQALKRVCRAYSTVQARKQASADRLLATGKVQRSKGNRSAYPSIGLARQVQADRTIEKVELKVQAPIQILCRSEAHLARLEALRKAYARIAKYFQGSSASDRARSQDRKVGSTALRVLSVLHLADLGNVNAQIVKTIERVGATLDARDRDRRLSLSRSLDQGLIFIRQA